LSAPAGGPSFGVMRRSLISILVLAGLAAATPAHAATRTCGLTARIDGVRYDVRETKGTVGCPTAKRVVTTFLRDATAPAGWDCFRGHGSSPYAASCARGHRVTVRAYAPT
jgi:hypothetical protein